MKVKIVGFEVGKYQTTIESTVKIANEDFVRLQEDPRSSLVLVNYVEHDLGHQLLVALQKSDFIVVVKAR